MAGPGPKLITCLVASMVLKRQRGKWQEQRPRELPASPDAKEGRASAWRVGAPLVRFLRPLTGWLSLRSSPPHWPRSLSEPAIDQSLLLEFRISIRLSCQRKRAGDCTSHPRGEVPTTAFAHLWAKSPLPWPLSNFEVAPKPIAPGPPPAGLVSAYQTFLRPLQTL